MKGSFFATGAARMDRMAQRLLEEAPGDRLRLVDEVLGMTLGDDLAAELAGAGAEVDDVVRAPDRVLVVLHHTSELPLASSFSTPAGMRLCGDIR